eukprot:118239-Pyramimonas_sp.AAC.1
MPHDAHRVHQASPDALTPSDRPLRENDNIPKKTNWVSLGASHTIVFRRSGQCSEQDVGSTGAADLKTDSHCSRRIQDVHPVDVKGSCLINAYLVSHVFRVAHSETGEELKSFNHVLCKKQKVDFVEQFNEKLLVKQGGVSVAPT